ncbi:MAG: TolC family protein [Kiritimatiellia bacterium]
MRNALDRVGDAARRLRIARSDRWPDLSLFAEAGRSGQGDGAFSQDDPEDTAAAGLSLKLDPDRRDQRDAVERARILLAAAERQAAQTRDEARVEVFEETERLLTARRQVALSVDNLRIARRRYENATLRFEAGELGNRDVVEAENGLLDARNTLVDTAIGHENARIRLLARIGLLDIGPEGALLEASGTSVPPNLFGPPEPLPLQQ